MSALLGLARAADHYDRAVRGQYATTLLAMAAGIAGIAVWIPDSSRLRLFIAGLCIGISVTAAAVFRWSLKEERAGHRAAADAAQQAAYDTLELLRKDARWN